MMLNQCNVRSNYLRQHLKDYIISNLSLTDIKPMADARLSRDCLGLARHRLLRGAAPLRKGESGGNFLSNNSGLRRPPKETRFFFIFAAGNSVASSSLFRFLEVVFTKD